MSRFLSSPFIALIALATVTSFNLSAHAQAYPDGNLWGAAQACGLPTTGLGYSNDPGFQAALQNALRSRQNCSQVASTIASLGRYDSYPGFNTAINRNFGNPNSYAPFGNSNLSQSGNLYGAAQACGLPTTGIPYSNDPSFQAGLQNALRSRQDCGQVANTISPLARYNGAYAGQNPYLNRGYGTPNYDPRYGNANYPRHWDYDHDHDGFRPY